MPPDLARGTGQPVFVTLAERGIVGAFPGQRPEHVPAYPVRGPIDVVGAGDAVTANLAAALAAGADLREAMELAMAAASLVIHQLGTTGTASIRQIASLVVPSATLNQPHGWPIVDSIASNIIERYALLYAWRSQPISSESTSSAALNFTR